MLRTDLQMLQGLPLDIKIAKSKLRINEAIDYFGADGLYVSFSGGKDSTVLHYLVREVELERWGEQRIPRVFCNTGLEFPEVVKFAKNIADVELRPEMSFVQVIKKYGYPVVSKEQSYFIYQMKTTKSEKLKKLRLNGNANGIGKISKKWQYLIDSDFMISNKCCDVMKKRPFKKYSKNTGRIPITGIMAEESRVRTKTYLQNGGCNSFEGNNIQSQPLGFWVEQDILYFLKERDIKIPTVYGEIVEKEINGSIILETTEQKRTGCVFCLYGLNKDTKERGENRIQRLKRTHPKIHDYCVRGGKYDENGLWIPDKGLGLAHVLEVLGEKY